MISNSFQHFCVIAPMLQPGNSSLYSLSLITENSEHLLLSEACLKLPQGGHGYTCNELSKNSLVSSIFYTHLILIRIPGGLQAVPAATEPNMNVLGWWEEAGVNGENPHVHGENVHAPHRKKLEPGTL